MAVKSPGFTANTLPQPAPQEHARPDLSVVPPAMRLDAHTRECAQCHAALDVPSPGAACVSRLCADGLSLLDAALSPLGVLAAQQATQVAS